MPKSTKPKKSEYERGRERGQREGSTDGYEFAMVIILLVLHDKLGIEKDDVITLAHEIDNYVAMVRSGRVRFDVMRKTLKDEYGISFQWIE